MDILRNGYSLTNLSKTHTLAECLVDANSQTSTS
jgi:hypothetical protein